MGAERPGAVGRPSRRRGDELERAFSDRFLEALTAGDPAEAEAVGQAALDAGMAVPAIHSCVIAPAMQRIGDLWQSDAMTVADEHLATAISASVLGQLFPHGLNAPPRSRQRIMLAAAPGEHHVLGLRMAADALEGAGFDVLYLGADMPLDGLLNACRAHKPAVLGLSVTMPLNVPGLIREVEAVGALANAPQILVAGQAAPLLLEQGLDVPVILHSEEVVSVVERLLSLPHIGDVVPPELAARVPPTRSGDQAGSDSSRTIESRFSTTVQAASETARVAGRHAYAMERLAYHDPLTGLWNRRAYDDRFQTITDGDPASAILMIDVDQFKQVNDTFGHAVGDATLVGVAKAMLETVRPGDFASRLGGDEFSILLPATDLTQAAAIAERFRSRVEGTMRDPPVTVSVGVARTGSSRRASSLAGDRALYDAKEHGRNRVTVTAD
ncbi:diguanylate cyclase [Gaiella sp.]|uniref:diguanylate cyclase n=1 Tax=Gaiella sp. TaxID=2663207 RepID=UPI0032631C06